MKNTGMPTHRRYEEERRKSTRHEVNVPARLVHDGGVLSGEIESISISGVGFATREVEPGLDDGTRVVLRASFSAADGERRLERRGAVIRSEGFFDGEADVTTYAIRFDEKLTVEFIDAVL